MTAYSSGRGHESIRDLNRDTFDAISHIMMRWSVNTKATRVTKFVAVSPILDYDFDSEPYSTPYSSTSWRCVLYAVLRMKLKLSYSTWASLHDMLRLTTRSNAWFSGRRYEQQFQLPQQKDLEVLLEPHLHPALAGTADVCDIRHWLLKMPVQRAL